MNEIFKDNLGVLGEPPTAGLHGTWGGCGTKELVPL